MKITAVEATTVSIPYRIHWRNLHTEREGGLARTELETTILQVRTDAGIEGVGEVRGGRVARDAVAAMRSHVLGADPLAIDRLLDQVQAATGWGDALVGLDIALHDILGKALDAPLYQLLGGRYRERVPFVWTLGIKDLPQRVAEAQEMVAAGWRHAIKLKVGVAYDVEHVVAVSQAIGEVPVRPDSNMGHPKDEALAMLRDMQRQGVRFELVEDPCPTDFAAYREIAEEIGVGISLHGGCRTPDELRAIVQAERPGVVCVNLDPLTWGVRGVVRVAHALEAVGIGCTMGPSHATGIKSAVGIHLATALRPMRYPHDLLGPLILADDLLEEPLQIAAGWAVAPDGPGLGVALDRAALERLSALVPAGTGDRYRDF